VVAVKIDKIQIIVSACRSVFLSAIMFIFVRQAAGLIMTGKASGFWFGAGVIGCIGFGMMIYFCVNYLISSPELKMLKQGMRQG
jgi:putative peptidoglycan lipid II flippase